MPKFFVMSDIHGFYDEMIEALDKAGFDKDNPDHWFIGCGDYFDRGRKPAQVMKYLNSLPQKILVKGNHEELFLECVDRQFPMSHDWHNGTAQTIIDLCPDAGTFAEASGVAYGRTLHFMEDMVDYVELKNHIFVHSWVPLTRYDNFPKYYTKNRNFVFNIDWRNATERDWDDARWGNPYDHIANGLLPNKTIVFGHWHCSAGWAIAEGRSEFDDDAKFDPFYGDGFISIDACTAHSGKCNVVVIEDEFMEE